MDLLKNHIVPIYLNGSIHVSLAVLALIQMTFYFCKLPFDYAVCILGFFGTLFSYNFIKYIQVFLYSRKPASCNLKVIYLLSICALGISFIGFLALNLAAQITCIILLGLAILYAVPLGKRHSNLRNSAGIKIYMVCFSWATVTLIVPVLNAHAAVDVDILLKFIQRFILVLILIGVFEIVDLSKDSKELKTLPQILGVTKTKLLLFFLLLIFFFLEFFKIGFNPIQAYNNLVIVILTSWFIYKASSASGPYFTLFWVESVPIVWWAIIVFEQYLGIL
ncbi:UbiA prenyltransferase family protein [Myroides sp. LJL119]